MEKPGTHNIWMGSAFLVIGALLTLLSFALFSGRGSILFWGAVLVGALQLLWGIGQRVHYAFLSPEQKRQRHAEATVIALLRCMAMVANADGTADEKEIATIARVYEHLMGTSPPLETIRAVVAKVGTGGSQPREFVASKGLQASTEGCVLIAKACQMVILADGAASESERRVFAQVLSGLGLPKDLFLKALGPSSTA